MTKQPEWVMEAHVFHSDAKICGKQYCINCGYIYGKNQFSQWAFHKGCNNKDHPGFQHARKLASRF